MLANERRDHNSALASGKNTAIHIIAEGLVIAVFFYISDPHTTDMDRRIAAILQEVNIPYSAIRSTSYFDARLDAKETRFEALGSKA